MGKEFTPGGECRSRTKAAKLVLGAAAVVVLVGGMLFWALRQGTDGGGGPDGGGSLNSAELRELVANLALVKLKKKFYRLELSSKAGGTYVMKYEDVYTGQRRQLRTPFIPAGAGRESVFFEDPPAQGKFRLVRVETRMVKNERTGITGEEMFATVDVLTGPKKGTRYEIARSNRKFIVRDYKAVLVLQAPGEENNPFEVEENDTFPLPYDSGATKKPYRFKGVDENGAVIIEWQVDGNTETLTLTPDAA